MLQRSAGMFCTAARPIGGRLKLRESPLAHEVQIPRAAVGRGRFRASRPPGQQVEDGTVVGHPEMHKPRSPSWRFSGVAIYEVAGEARRR